jgi:hypothetical protein
LEWALWLAAWLESPPSTPKLVAPLEIPSCSCWLGHKDLHFALQWSAITATHIVSPSEVPLSGSGQGPLPFLLGKADTLLSPQWHSDAWLFCPSWFQQTQSLPIHSLFPSHWAQWAQESCPKVIISVQWSSCKPQWETVSGLGSRVSLWSHPLQRMEK